MTNRFVRQNVLTELNQTTPCLIRVHRAGRFQTSALGGVAANPVLSVAELGVAARWAESTQRQNADPKPAASKVLRASCEDAEANREAAHDLT
jgi:hypothetical protein